MWVRGLGRQKSTNIFLQQETESSHLIIMKINLKITIKGNEIPIYLGAKQYITMSSTSLKEISMEFIKIVFTKWLRKCYLTKLIRCS